MVISGPAQNLWNKGGSGCVQSNESAGRLAVGKHFDQAGFQQADFPRIEEAL
jgi:hypothetical protein